MDRLKIILSSKTFWGAVLSGGAWLIAQPHVGITELIQAGGAILTAAGVRDSFTKATTAP